MKRIGYVFPVLLMIFISCNNRKHFITDSQYRNIVEIQFEKQKLMAANRDSVLFSVFDTDITLQEKEALMFLYAYMPLCDLADYDGNFYLKNVRYAFYARDSFLWGNSVPEEIFRHFVLPVRVHSENLDTSRFVFYNELKDRVKNLSMRDAALEVNHWCHEKVTYKASDSRTASPLSTMLTSTGRCGEESVFTVAAMRSVGIPSRLCYTPRWAHCDDNHGWVEVWIDGKWYYIGACEPEHDFNIAWFSSPSLRAMLVTTNAFGNYNGTEEILSDNEFFTKINITSNYAQVKTIFIKVVDSLNKPVDSAAVDFCVFNYAEFYPLVKKYTDKSGITQLTTGMGDMLVWVNKKNSFGFCKVSVPAINDTLVVYLDKNPNNVADVEVDLVPPEEKIIVNNTDEKVKFANTAKLKYEDSLRSVYMSTFADSAYSAQLAMEFDLNSDSVYMYLAGSKGNWKAISNFIKNTPENMRMWILPLLSVISEKDLCDTPFEVLLDHLKCSSQLFERNKYPSVDLFTSYVLCPRIINENLKSYKSFLKIELDKIWINKSVDAALIMKWIVDNIIINTSANYYNTPLSPIGSFQLKVSDEKSRNILFVAICRTYGIPAEVETSTNKPRFYENNSWKYADFEKQEHEIFTKGTVVVSNNSDKKDFVPVYSVHYTLAFYENGRYVTLNYEGSPQVVSFPYSLELRTGHYLLITGTRLADGSVLSDLHFFTLHEGSTVDLSVKLRESNDKPELLGTMNLVRELMETGTDKKVEIASLAKKNGCVLLWIDPDKEPSKHIIAEIQQLKQSFDNWGGGMAFVVSKANSAVFDINKYRGLPAQSIFLTDDKYSLLSEVELVTNKKLKDNLPVIVLVNPGGGVIFLLSGYSPGSGERLVKMLKKTVI